MASIVFTDLIIYNTQSASLSNTLEFIDSCVYTETENTNVSVMFTKVNFISNQFLTQSKGTLLIENHFTCDCYHNYPVSIQLTDCIFNKNTAADHVVSLNIITNEEYYQNYDNTR